MLVSIIIVNYNTFQFTCDCIRSINELTKVEHEIILVDNNSKECPATDFLKAHPHIKLLPLAENVGFGRANNAGVEQAKGKYVLLLNSDTLVNENTIDETVGYLEANPDMDILGCKVLTNGGVIQRTVYEYKGELSLFRSVIFFVKRNAIVKEIINWIYRRGEKLKQQQKNAEAGSEDHDAQDKPEEKITPNYYNHQKIGSLVGVFLLLKRSVYLESKGFDPDFFMYDEELNWFLMRLRNYNKVYYPKVHIQHFYGKSDVYRKMNLQRHVSQYLFWYKVSLPHYFLFILYNIIEIPSRGGNEFCNNQ